MLEKTREYLRTAILSKTISGLFLLCGLLVPTFGQIAENTQTTATQIADKKSETPVLMPVLTEYKGLKIGATAEEVRDKLGKAKIDDKDGFFYDSDGEMVQIVLDADKKARVFSITYSDKSKNAPTYADVFGADTPAPTEPDGSIYNLVRYPEAGYWVAYSRTAGENPTVTVTMQKL